MRKGKLRGSLIFSTYSLSLSTDNPNTNGILEYNLLQNKTNSVWSGELPVGVKFAIQKLIVNNSLVKRLS